MIDNQIPLQLSGNPELVQVAKRAVAKHLIEAVPRTLTAPTKAVGHPTVAKTLAAPKEIKLPPKPVAVKLEKITPQEQQKLNTQTIRTIAGVHLEIYDHFNMSPSTIGDIDLRHLQAIHNWAWKDTTDLYEAMQKLHRLELSAGKNVTGEAHLNKIYNTIRLRSLRGKS